MENKKLKEPHFYTNRFKFHTKKLREEYKNDRSGYEMQVWGDLNKLFRHVINVAIQEGRDSALSDKSLIKRPELKEEQLAYMAQINPDVVNLITKFNLEI